MVAARQLAPNHHVTVFEKNNYIGGHTNTIATELGGETFAIDTGFIVFNDWTYPNFIALLEELGIESQPSQMSFSVRCAGTGIEYNGHSLNTLYAQRRNLLRPRFHRMLLEILRFNREALRFLEQDSETATLGEFLDDNGFQGLFVTHYIVPMGAAIWSMDPVYMREFPARFFLEFFRNHGLLNVRNRPTWRVVKGGSWKYVAALTAPLKDRIRLSTPVTAVHRGKGGVTVTSDRYGSERFDHVVLACHSDEAISLLDDASPSERSVLGAIRYQSNEAVLHTDSSILPERRKAWAAWNYHIPENGSERVALTYNMNILQGLEAPRQFCVTLNRGGLIDPRSILKRIDYAHPMYEPASVAARRRHDEINGVRNTWYCGAYWGYGFHEDGVNSALKVCNAIGGIPENEKLHLLRTA